MPRHFAFLRAVNVGGRTIRMADLAAQFRELGFTEVETFIASGNVVFTAGSCDAAGLERRIADALRGWLGYDVATFIRSAPELAAIVRYRPFDEAAMARAMALNVALLERPLSAPELQLVRGFTTDRDRFHVAGRELYWLCDTRQSDSTFANAAFEKRLQLRATFRGANTLVRLAAKFCAVHDPALVLGPAPQR